MKSDIMDIDLSKTEQADKSRKEIEAHMKKVTFFKYLQCQFSISISIFNVKNIFDFIRIYNVTKYFKCSISSNGNFQLTGASEVPWIFIGGRFIGGAEETVAAHKFDLVNIQSWKMSNLLHGPISTNQILPEKSAKNFLPQLANFFTRIYPSYP